MMKLNPQQLEAVRYLGGPLLVLAGAGSGKTGVITQKIKHLIVNVGYLPHTVAAITFTNKAAAEMQERVAEMLPKSQTRGLTICTFHSLGMKIFARRGEPYRLQKKLFHPRFHRQRENHRRTFGRYGQRSRIQGAAPDFLVEKRFKNA
ncbi:ATP-dependent DNA helicase [Neisseria meningitidis 992008]|nr:ATP-dependent DNA helicase [Neisseria meningitidis 992008]